MKPYYIGEINGSACYLLEKPVNRIGSSAREFMTGDFTSAMQRGCESGDPSARLMAKMHGASQSPTLEPTTTNGAALRSSAVQVQYAQSGAGKGKHDNNNQT